jgi:hypothetical protein
MPRVWERCHPAVGCADPSALCTDSAASQGAFECRYRCTSTADCAAVDTVCDTSRGACQLNICGYQDSQGRTERHAVQWGWAGIAGRIAGLEAMLEWIDSYPRLVSRT